MKVLLNQNKRSYTKYKHKKDMEPFVIKHCLVFMPSYISCSERYHPHMVKSKFRVTWCAVFIFMTHSICLCSYAICQTKLLIQFSVK